MGIKLREKSERTTVNFYVQGGEPCDSANAGHHTIFLMKNNKGKKAKRVCSALLAGGLATCTAASFLPATASADSISVSPSGDVKTNTGISSGSEDSNKMSYSEASERFSKIQMDNSITGGNIHLSFSYASTPMVILTNQPLDGYEFVKYIITDDSGNTVSRDDLCNLNFTGEVKVGAQFKKKASETEQENTEKQRKLEEMKSRAKLIKSGTSTGGNVNISIDYTQDPPVRLNASPYDGYKFSSYVIKDEDGNDVSLGDLENLNITEKVYVSGIFTKVSSGSTDTGGTTKVDDSDKGISYSEALNRYNSITTPQSVTGGTFHVGFNYDSAPMITLTESAYDGYKFKGYVITDDSGKTVSMNDLLNLNFTGNVNLTAEFEKTSTSSSSSDKESEKEALEKKKAAFKLLTFKNAEGGNIGVTVNYESDTPVNVTNTPADGYTFDKYVITDSDGNVVLLDDVEKLNITKATTVTPVFKKTGGSSGSSSSTGTVIKTNHGLTSAQAVARYNNIDMLNSKNGTYHMTFNFSSQPMITLTNTPYDGCTFSKYVIRDADGNDISLDDFVNLQFTGKATITAEFTKPASSTDAETEEEKAKKKYEELKEKFNLLSFKSAEGGNISAAFDYTATPPVTVTETPASGYKFVKYVIKNAGDEDVSLDDVENLNISSKTTVTPVFEKTSASGGSSGGSTSTEPAKNAGLTSAQALARYEKIEMLNSKNGTYHMSFNFSSHPMITLTNAPFDGYKFSKYVITDEAGREVSFDDFCNLNFDGKVKITAEFTKGSQSSDSDSTEEAEKKKYEELKTKFKEITVNTPTGGNVYMSFNYSATPPAVVTNTPASGYTFDSYVIKDANGNDVSLGDLQSLNISGPVTLTAKFTKIKTDEEKKEEEANKPKTNHGLTAEQALARYDRMLLANTKNGTLHTHFDFEKTPMVTLTPEADDGYVFSQFVITDENGNTVSEDNAKNLQYTGSITVQTIFRKKDTTSEKEPSKSDTDAEKQKYTKLKNKFDMIHFSQAVGGSISAKFDYTATPPLSVSKVTFEGYTFKGYSIKDEDGNDVSFDDLQNLNITKKVNVSGIFEKKASDASQTTISSDTKNAGLTYAQALERYKKIKLPDSIKGGTVHLSFDFTKTPMITFTETPEDGYVFDKFSITDENGKGVSTDDLYNLNFTGTVTVSAVFEKKEERQAKEQAAKEKEKYDWYKEKFDMLTFKKAVGGDLHVKFDYSATPPLTLTPSAYKGYKFDTYKLTYANGHTANLEDVLDLDIQSKVTVQPVFVKLNSASETVTVSSKTKSATAKKTSPSKTSTTKTVTSKTSSKSTSKTASKKTSTKKASTKKTVAKKTSAKKTAAKKSSAKKSSSSQVLTISSSSSRSKKRTSAPSITVTMKGRVITYSIKNVKESEHVEVQFRKLGSSSWKAASDRNLRKMTNGTYYFRARIFGRGYKSSWSAAKTITRNVPTKHKSKKK